MSYLIASKENTMKAYKNILLTLILSLSLSSCGAYNSIDTANDYKTEESASYHTEEAEDKADESFDISNEILANNKVKDRKIEYFYEYQIETTDYDTDYKNLKEMVDKNKGYIDSSNFYVDRANDGKIDLRNYSASIKIPMDDSAKFAKELTSIGKINNINQSSNDLTLAYKDGNLRLETKENELKKLNELMEKSESIDDTMAIQARILEVEADLDQIKSDIRQIDQRVLYNTFNIDLREVYDYSPLTKNKANFGQRLTQAFKDSIGIFTNFIGDFIIIIVSYWPLILILALVIVFVIRRIRKKDKKNIDKKDEQIKLINEKDNN